MIGKLTGVIDSLYSDNLIIDVAGVGYLVHCSSQVISNLTIGSIVKLWIEMQVKENDITLYGFQNLMEKEWFNHLISVQGVGSKVALAILSALKPEEIITAIFSESVADFKRISGIGPKLASRIVNELKNKQQIFADISKYVVNKDAICSITNNQDGKRIDAISALTNLGFNNRSEIIRIVNETIEHEPQIILEDIIKQALSKLKV